MLLQKSIQGAVIILVIIVIRALFINKLPKRTFVILWVVAVFCLLFPFPLKSRISVYTLAEKKGISSSEWGMEKKTEYVSVKSGDGQKERAGTEGEWQGEAALSVQGGQDGSRREGLGKTQKEMQQKFPQTAVWTLLYLSGAILCAGYFGIVYFRCCREFSTSLPVDNEAVSQWLKAHALKRKIAIRQLDSIKAPLTYGIFSPVILLPKNIKWESGRKVTEESEEEKGISGRHPDFIPQELRLCLEHEFVHIKCLDGVTKLILTAALCLHWFNPLVWVMYIFANRDLELSCDEMVVRTLGEHVKSDYARTLIRMEETKSGLIPLGSNFSKNAIEERITAVMKVKKFTLLTAGAAVILVVLVTLTFATSAAEKKDTDIECVKELLGEDYTQEEAGMLAKLWFEDYEDMTVNEFHEKAWDFTDSPEYHELVERFSNTAMEYGQQVEKGEDGNAFWQYFYYVYEPLNADRWKIREFGDYARKDFSTKENPDLPKTDLEYFLTLSILKPDVLTVKEYNDTRLRIKEDLQEFWQGRTAKDLWNDGDREKKIDDEINRIVSGRNSEKLAVSIEYFYMPLDGYSFYVFENKLEAEDKGTVNSYDAENEQETRQEPYGTRQDYESLLALKTEGYEKMSLEDFNGRLLDWCNENPDAMERTGTDAFRDDYQVTLTKEEKRFVSLTVQLSRFENAAWVMGQHRGKPEEDPWWGGFNYMEQGDDIWCRLYFQFSYHISDKSRGTVGERDQCIESMMNCILKFWQETELEERIKLSEEEVINKFKEWAKTCSNEVITIGIDESHIRYEHGNEREYADERVYLGTVSAEGNLRTYISADAEGKQSKYFHLTVANHTEKEISGVEYSMLAYDMKGRPLELYWTFLDSEKDASYGCTVKEQCAIPPGDVYDQEGGWSVYDMESPWELIDLSPYGKDYKVEYVLSCIVGITFEDGTLWSNPDYETWKEECYGKKVPYSVLGEYGRQEYEVYGIR